jgi:hypothetical protein
MSAGKPDPPKTRLLAILAPIAHISTIAAADRWASGGHLDPSRTTIRPVRTRTPQLKRRIDLTGRRVNGLRVLGPVTDRDGCLAPNGRWLCRCKCGRTVDFLGSHLRAGAPRSCGCHRRPAGQTRTREYQVWGRMVAGGDCCARWMRSFDVFLKDIGARPAGHKFFRLDPRRPYGPKNCIWVPAAEWSGHRLRLTYRGVVRSQSEWARRFGISQQGLGYLLKVGNTLAQLVARYGDGGSR